MQNTQKNNRIFLIGIILIIAVVIFTMVDFSLNDKKTAPPELQPEKDSLYSDYSYLLPRELSSKILDKENLLVLDIRDEINFTKNHIKYSLNIPLNYLSEKINELDKEKLIVVVGYNYSEKKPEASAMKLLKESGFNNIVALSGGIDNWYNEKFPLITMGNPESIIDRSKIESIHTEQLKIAIENDYPIFIIDTRPILLYKQGHIPGAINLALSQFESKSKEISITKEIVVYGESSLADFHASIKLFNLGFLANYTLNGGFDEWKKKGFPLEK